MSSYVFFRCYNEIDGAETFVVVQNANIFYLQVQVQTLIKISICRTSAREGINEDMKVVHHISTLEFGHSNVLGSNLSYWNVLCYAALWWEHLISGDVAYFMIQH